jgi:predicted O-methyltransferase YrrM
MGSPFAGIGPADVHTRDPRMMPLVTSGARVVGTDISAEALEVAKVNAKRHGVADRLDLLAGNPGVAKALHCVN